MPDVGESIMYPAPNIKWYPNAVESGLELPTRECGIQPPPPPRPRPEPRRHDVAGGAARFIEVSLSGASDLKVLEGSPEGNLFTATAHYPDEPFESATARMLGPVQASSSSRSPGYVDCPLEGCIRVPFNSRQQFLKVSVHVRSSEGESLLGQATLPIADPSAGDLSEWSLLRNFEEVGFLSLRVSEPFTGSGVCEAQVASAARHPSSAAGQSGSDSPPPPPLGTVADDASQPEAAAAAPADSPAHPAELAPAPPPRPASQASHRAPTPPPPAPLPTLSGAHHAATSSSSPPPAAQAAGRAVERLRVGDPVQVWSRSAGRWERGVVIEANGDDVTVEYGNRRRDLNVADENLGEHLRRPPAEAASKPADPSTEASAPADPAAASAGARLDAAPAVSKPGADFSAPAFPRLTHPAPVLSSATLVGGGHYSAHAGGAAAVWARPAAVGAPAAAFGGTQQHWAHQAPGTAAAAYGTAASHVPFGVRAPHRGVAYR